MVLTETALMGIACLMANAPSQGVNQIHERLSTEEKQTVAEMIQDQEVLPDCIENILEKGKLNEPTAMHLPTELC